MNSTYEQYRKFLGWLVQENALATPDIRRIANIIDVNFAEVHATTSAARSRSVVLSKLLLKEFSTASEEFVTVSEQSETKPFPWTRLTHLTVGPFRGFRRPEPFELDHRVVLFYGPNGSGKTSLCEAVEHALLGSVDESKVNRIGDDYLINLHDKTVDTPTLLVRMAGEPPTQVSPDPDLYRFCFIEKNRIDAFSRIASRTSAQRKDLIASLFGIEDFSDFVGHFNEVNVMERQLQPSTIKSEQLLRARTANTTDQTTVKSELETLALRTEEENKAANEYKEGSSYQDILALIGTTEVPGRLKQLKDILLAPTSTLMGVTLQTLQEQLQAAERAYEEAKSLEETRRERATDISYKDLYAAIQKLKALELDICPACETPLGIAIKNPFDKADAALEVLNELVELEQKIVIANKKMEEASTILLSTFQAISNFSDKTKSDTYPALENISTSSGDRWWQPWLFELEDGSFIPSIDLIEDVESIENRDSNIRQAASQRSSDIAELEKLTDLNLKITELKLKRQQITEEISSAKNRIADFENANSTLITEAADEALKVADSQRILRAYDSYRTLIKRYCTALPGHLVSDLNTIVLDLYNNFNQDDPEEDLLAQIKLPPTENDRIEISFKTAPNKLFDALHVLSEGHIRCLGLAILLGKNIQQGVPLVIFDDAVNAIDHDHRRGIRETLFRHPALEEKQLLITCHSDDFITSIQNLLPKNQQAQLYVFRPSDGARHPNILRKTGLRHYLEQANVAFEEGRIAACLQHCRQALELLNLKIWNWLSSHDLGTLTLQLNSASASPGSRNITDALRKNLETPTFTPPEKETLLAGLKTLTGIPAANLVWKYLNKGTHVEGDRDDFEIAFVKLALVTLNEMNEIKLKRA